MQGPYRESMKPARIRTRRLEAKEALEPQQAKIRAYAERYILELVEVNKRR